MTSPVFTVGDIARIAEKPVHCVEYLVRTRHQLRPRGRVGNARIYTESDVQFILGELRQIDEQKGTSK